MKFRLALILWVIPLLVPVAHSAEEEAKPTVSQSLEKDSPPSNVKEVSKEAPAGIQTDEATFKEIFEGNVTRAKAEVEGATSAFRLTPTFSWASIDELSTANNYFTVPISNSVNSIPLFQAQFSFRTLSWKGLELLPNASVGYGMKESQVTARSKLGTNLSDLLRIHWLPLSLGGQVSYKIPGLKVVKVFVNPSIGVQWLYQSGRLDGIDQGFWIPFYKLGGGVNLFDQSEKDASAWFGGVNLSAETLSSFGSAQTSKLWKLDVGLTLLL